MNEKLITSNRGQRCKERRAFPSESVAGIKRITIRSFGIPREIPPSVLSLNGKRVPSGGGGVGEDNETVIAFLIVKWIGNTNWSFRDCNDSFCFSIVHVFSWMNTFILQRLMSLWYLFKWMLESFYISIESFWINIYFLLFIIFEASPPFLMILE